MVRRFLAGLLLVMGGAAIAVGVSPPWVTPAGSGQALNGFTMGSTPVDAVVSFVLGGVLMLVGLVIALRGGVLSRALGMLTSLLAVVCLGGCDPLSAERLQARRGSPDAGCVLGA